ncbi:MAG: helix-turn-helix transcriptional regulator [Desulfobacterales bacterium]|jgi:transcriptional regulator with XRE-family HTH domain
MDPKQQAARADYVRSVLQEIPLPRNQLAAASGLSNTYIRDLEQGNIANVAREKLIAFSVALNLSLKGIDEMLNRFDRAPLSTDDIELFLQTAAQRRFSSALVPIRDDFTLGLVLLSTERIAGAHVIVSSEPTVCLRQTGHIRYAQRRLAENHPIHGPLVEAIAENRRITFLENLKRHPIRQYICRHCLEDYVRHCDDPTEKEWRIAHLHAVAETLRTRANWQFFLTDTCPTFIFTLKTPADRSGSGQRLILTRQPPHRFQGRRLGKLAGFVTGNFAIVESFRKELESIAGVVIGDLCDRPKLIAYLERLTAG